MPDFLDYRMNNRTYRYFKGEALFPFGHGLSYTTFDLSAPKYKKGKVVLSVTNTGKREGTETIQVYLKRMDDHSELIKSLKAFQRVTLKAGETRTVEIDLPRDRFECWDDQTNTMRVVPGKYLLMTGNSSATENLKMRKIKIR